MYSFQPLVDTTVNSHNGFYIAILAIGIIVAIVLNLWNDRECTTGTMLCWVISMAGILYMVFHFSYAPEIHYANTPYTAKFVSFQPEGYNERSGKSRADRHYMYVVYDVNGEHVILKASEGITYPKTTTLYKN